MGVVSEYVLSLNKKELRSLLAHWRDLMGVLRRENDDLKEDVKLLNDDLKNLRDHSQFWLNKYYEKCEQFQKFANKQHDVRSGLEAEIVALKDVLSGLDDETMKYTRDEVRDEVLEMWKGN